MSSRYPMSANPIGWYRILGSDELRLADLKAVTAFGRPLAVFRDQSGVAHVVDAHCPHLGADLTVGGRIDGDDLVCPFHGWHFDGTGRCTLVVPEGRIPSRAQLRSFPTAEVNGAVVAHWHPEAAAPTWALPPVDGFDDVAEFTPWERRSWTIRTHVQEVFENGPDTTHQRTLHCALELPTSGSEVDGHRFRGTLQAPYQAGDGLPDAVAQQDASYENHGLGYARFEMALDYDGLAVEREIHFWTTPIDDERIVATLETRMRRLADADLTALVHREATHHTWRSFEEDIPIWEHKVYRPLPELATAERPGAVLVDADRGVLALRRWARQFYVD